MTNPYQQWAQVPPAAPAAPQFPAAPAAPQFPQQAYPQQFAPQFPQQAYPQQFAAPVPPAAPLPQGTLDAFFAQPTVSGGPSWTFKDKQLGTSYIGIVERDVIDGDIQPQTIPGTNQPALYRDGRQKFVMKVSLVVQPSPEFPEGKASWFVAGQARDELARAMSEAGAPTGAPEKGALVQVTLVGKKPARTAGFNASNIYQCNYQRPEGAAAVPQAPAPAAPVAAPAPAPVAPSPLPAAAGVAPGQTVPTAFGQQPVQVPQAPVAAPVAYPQQPAYLQQPAPIQAAPAVQAMAAAAPVAPGAAAPQMPSDLSADQQALLARLTAGQAAA